MMNKEKQVKVDTLVELVKLKYYEEKLHKMELYKKYYYAGILEGIRLAKKIYENS